MALPGALSPGLPKTDSMIKDRPEKGRARWDTLLPSCPHVPMGALWIGGEGAVMGQAAEPAQPVSEPSPSTPVLAMGRGLVEESVWPPGWWRPEGHGEGEEG